VKELLEVLPGLGKIERGGDEGEGKRARGGRGEGRFLA
jgi:hypothetical protein